MNRGLISVACTWRSDTRCRLFAVVRAFDSARTPLFVFGNVHTSFATAHLYLPRFNFDTVLPGEREHFRRYLGYFRKRDPSRFAGIL